MITEKILRSNPALIKALTGLPADEFWRLIAEMEAKEPEYERQRHERPDRQRAVGAGHPCAQWEIVGEEEVLTRPSLSRTESTTFLPSVKQRRGLRMTRSSVMRLERWNTCLMDVK